MLETKVFADSLSVCCSLFFCRFAPEQFLCLCWWWCLLGKWWWWWCLHSWLIWWCLLYSHLLSTRFLPSAHCTLEVHCRVAVGALANPGTTACRGGLCLRLALSPAGVADQITWKVRQRAHTAYP